MGYVDLSASHASATAIPQATAAATYFIFGPSGSNAFGATDQSLTATPSATAVAATGGPAGASGTGSNEALAPANVAAAPASGVSTETILIIAAAGIAALLIARRFL